MIDAEISKRDTMEQRAVFFQREAAFDHAEFERYRDAGNRAYAALYASFESLNFIYAWACRFGNTGPEPWA
jgi:hypothetical protein